MESDYGENGRISRLGQPGQTSRPDLLVRACDRTSWSDLPVGPPRQTSWSDLPVGPPNQTPWSDVLARPLSQASHSDFPVRPLRQTSWSHLLVRPALQTSWSDLPVRPHSRIPPPDKSALDFGVCEHYQEKAEDGMVRGLSRLPVCSERGNSWPSLPRPPRLRVSRENHQPRSAFPQSEPPGPIGRQGR
jgi:hypothetical protein